MFFIENGYNDKNEKIKIVMAKKKVQFQGAQILRNEEYL